MFSTGQLEIDVAVPSQASRFVDPECFPGENGVSFKKVDSFVIQVPINVLKTPNFIAHEDLLERVLDHGVVFDAGSRMRAVNNDRSLATRTGGIEVVVRGVKGLGERRRGAPMCQRSR